MHWEDPERWAGEGGEGRSGWGIHVDPWLIHVNVWQKPLQYCKIISLQLIKINGKKRKFPAKGKPWDSWGNKKYYPSTFSLSSILWWIQQFHPLCHHNTWNAIICTTKISMPSLPNLSNCAGTSDKEPTCQCRRHKRHKYDPQLGKIPQRRPWYPLQHSWLENPMDRGAWQATVHWVTKSQTQMKWLSMHAHYSLGLKYPFEKFG